MFSMSFVEYSDFRSDSTWVWASKIFVLHTKKKTDNHQMSEAHGNIHISHGEWKVKHDTCLGVVFMRQLTSLICRKGDRSRKQNLDHESKNLT